MRLWRLSERRALDGEGARLFGGRWNPPGVAVIYAAATCALATLEFIVHFDPTDGPRDVFAHLLDVPDGVSAETVDERDLPRGWDRYPAPERLQEIGSAWAAAKRALVLSVPSAVLRVPPALAPTERNYLIDPAHPDFARLRSRLVTLKLDPRLWR